MTDSSEALWSPSDRRVEQTRLHAFTELLHARGHGPFEDFAELHWFSVNEPAAFWNALWDFCKVVGTKGDTAIEAADRMVDVRFFPEASLNIAENVLRPKDDPDALLIVSADENGVTGRLTRAELVERVAHMQALFVDAGVGPGDTVAVWLPNIALSYIVWLAAAGLGATFVSTSPDFGVDGVLDRFSQVDPKVLIAVDGYTYGGRRFDCLERLGTIVDSLPTLERVWVQETADGSVSATPPDAGSDSTTVADAVPEFALPDIASPLDAALSAVEPIEARFDRLPFDHPVFVLFSSGTTGKPKPIVHRAGGVLLTHMKEHQLACDIRPDDRVMYFTTTGWMMWNWLATVPASGSAIVVYDGNPAHPSMSRLFSLVDDVGVTLFGTSAKFIESMLKSGIAFSERHGLASIRTFASTGSPLSDEGFRFVYDSVASDVHLMSMSGGTDLCGCLVGGDPTGPVFSGEIQRPVLGIAVDVYDEVGRSCGPGEQGELVCTSAFPSMPLTFLGDDGAERYHAAYFERFDNVWHQGDFAEWTPRGGLVIHGRSDATLNPGGVRIGTAEIYAQVEKVEAVLESLVIGQQVAADTRVVLFVRMRDGHTLTDALADDIRRTVRAGATPRHVPSVVLAVDDLPRTRSGKIAEIAVREIVHGREVRNQTALANPEALDLFRDLAALRVD